MTTLASLATAVSRKRGDLEEKVSSDAGTTTTLICNTLVIGGNDEFAGDEVLFPNRALAPVRRITASEISTYTLTLAPALPTATASGESFEKRRRHLYADVVAAINMAITEIAPVYPVLVPSSTTVYLASGQDEYSIPSIFTRVYAVEINTDNSGNYHTLAPLQWDVRPGGKLWIADQFRETYQPYGIRISGYRNPSTLASRTDDTPIALPYILAYCDWYLAGQVDSTQPPMLDLLFKTKEYERSRAVAVTKPNTKAVLI